jgi:Holliday junction resolvase RusA-like endonuclease
MEIKFVVNAVPVAQPRQRHAIVAGHGVNYTPEKHPVNSFKAAVAYSCRAAYSGPVLDCPIEVCIAAVFPRPKGMMFKTKPMPREWKTSKPDVDNIQKSVYDALNGVLWRDDSLICCAHTHKQIASGCEFPMVVITVSTCLSVIQIT